MQVSAYLGPEDHIPYELINEGLINKENSPEVDTGGWDRDEIASILTKFSLFQRYCTNTLSVHRLVQEVIRSQLKKKAELTVLSQAVCVLHNALKDTLSPAEVCETFVEEEAVFSIKNPPSLQLWGKLASHATYLQEHLCEFSAKYNESVDKLLYTEKTLRIFNEAAIFLSVSQEKVKAQEIQKLTLEVLVKLKESTTEDRTKLPDYFIDIPLKDGDYKLISRCMRQSVSGANSLDDGVGTFHSTKKANELREEGNLFVKNKQFKEASERYSRAIGFSPRDYRLFANRALCYLKLSQPEQALDDCEKCLSLDPHNSKALQRKVWALHDLVENGAKHLMGQKMATLAVAVHFHPCLRHDKGFSEIFPEVCTHSAREISNETQLAFALMTSQRNETFLLREGKYNLKNFTAFTDLQMVGLEQVVLNCVERCAIFSKCYFENLIFPKGSTGIVCQGKDASIHMNHCELSGGSASCEDFPECDGGPGCIAASLRKPVCDRAGNFGHPVLHSGIPGYPGVQITQGSFAVIEDSVVHDCGGGGALVACEGSYLEVKKCEVYRNHQTGLEAREGGKLIASRNRIFKSGYDGILIGPRAGECDVNENKIFENAKEGVFVGRNTNKIVVRNNDVHHNSLFGISLDEDSCLLISNNRIFENGFWGIQAKLRTTAKITGNIIFGNKCGGIIIGINYSGRVHLDANIIRDHSGPWLFRENDNLFGRFFPDGMPAFAGSPPGEKKIYFNPPILSRNKEFNNQEGIYHPREVVKRLHDGCTFCHRSIHEVDRPIMCPTCQIASYCSTECQRTHFNAHEALCNALKSRYSVTFKISSLVKPGEFQMSTAAPLKDTGTDPEPTLGSCRKLIVKIQTQDQNGHPKQMLSVNDKTRTINCKIQSPKIFSVIMECGVLGNFLKNTSKKVFFWAMFEEGEDKLKIFLDHLAPYQQW